MCQNLEFGRRVPYSISAEFGNFCGICHRINFQSINHFILQTKTTRESEAIKHSQRQPESMTSSWNIGGGNCFQNSKTSFYIS